MTEEALSVPCPRCKAQPGEACHTYRGQEIEPHAGRKPPSKTFLCPACHRVHERHDEKCRQFRIKRQEVREREMEQWKKGRAA